MKTKPIYLIFVRPRGSVIWTIHMKKSGIPWRTSIPDKANHEAVTITNGINYCARVTRIDMPSEADSEDSGKYAALADGDTLFVSSV